MQRPSTTWTALLPVVLFSAAFATAAQAQTGELRGELRVCAEPANFPVSDRSEKGFENRIARLVADDLGLRLSYTWHPYWRGFVRKTLGADRCDVLIGVPTEFDRVLTTRPYYRSSYVFVTAADEPPVLGFDDERLWRSRVGLPLVKNDLTTTPPGFALAPNGPKANLVGYSVYEEPPVAERIVEGVASGELRVGVLWGPQAGYYAKHGSRPLQLSLASAPPPHAAMLPFQYSISMGVRKSDRALRDRLDGVIERRGSDIDRILEEYGVPRIGLVARRER
jgi:mxaJ protein